MSVLSTDEDWSIISSSDMEDQSTTSSVHYEDDEAIRPGPNPGPDPVLDSQNTITGRADQPSYSDKSVDPKGRVECVTRRKEAAKDDTAEKGTRNVSAKTVGGEKSSLTCPFLCIDRYIRGLSSSFYSLYLKESLRKLQLKIQTPSVRYKVTNWANVIAVTNPENFRVRNEDLYLHERAILMMIEFLNSQEQFLVYWLLAWISVVLVTGAVALGLLSIVPAPEVAPPSINDKMASFWDNLVYQTTETTPASWFSSKKQPVKVMRFSKELDGLWKQGSAQLSNFQKHAALYGAGFKPYYASVLSTVGAKATEGWKLAALQFRKGATMVETSRTAVASYWALFQPKIHAAAVKDYAASAEAVRSLLHQLQNVTVAVLGNTEKTLAGASAFLSKLEPHLKFLLEASKNKIDSVSILAYQQTKPLFQWVESKLSAW